MSFLKKKNKSSQDSTSSRQKSRSSNHPAQPSSSQVSQPPLQQPQWPKGPDFRPVVMSIQDQEWLHQRFVLIYGRAGPDEPFDGQLVVDHHNNSFPSQSFPVTDSHFKVLVHLVPGPNNINLTFIPPPEIAQSMYTTHLTLHYLPLLQTPPVHLAVILARDSEGSFEAPPDRPNTLDDAISRFRMAAYLWQMYTAEQLFRNFPGKKEQGLGSARRSFRLEEEWSDDTLSLQESGARRMTAKIHVVRSPLSVAEMAAEVQNPQGKGVKTIVRDALEEYGGPFKVSEGYSGPAPTVLCLLLDMHWRELMRPGKQEVFDSQLRIGIFISRTLWSWPSCMEEIIHSFQDDTRLVPSSPGMSQRGSLSYYGSTFEAASAGLGGMMRELGYTFGCPLEEPGSATRNLQTFHRTFVTREGQISRTQLQGLRPCLPSHESSWHRIDCILFRYHPCFRLPLETEFPSDKVVYWPCENGLIVTSPSGIILILIRLTQRPFPVAWFEYPERPEKEVFLFESDIVERLPPDLREPGQDVFLEIISAGGGRVRVDWQRIMREGRTHVPQQSTEIFQSRMVGRGSTLGSQDLGFFIFNSQYLKSALINIRISHADVLYSIEFQYADETVLTFGIPHPRGRVTDVPIDSADGEKVLGFRVCADEWVDAITIVTNRKQSAWIGKTTKHVFEMIPPQGYEVVGITGQVGQCIDMFGVVYASNT